MSDDQKPPVKDAMPTQPGEGDGAKLTSRQLSMGDHIFIWTMVILVGVIFGIGPSFGLIFASRGTLSSYNVDPIQVERRQRTAETLQAVLDPQQFTEVWTQRSVEGYAREYRKAQVAEDRGLLPNAADAEKLLEDFYVQQTFRDRGYLETLQDDRRGAELSREALRTFLAERFANDALDARLAIAPVLPRQAAATTMTLVQTGVNTEQVTLSAKPLLETVAEDDPDLERTYGQMLARDRFISPAVRLVTVAVADPATHLEAQPQPDDAAIAAWYDANRERFKVVPEGTPEVGQSLPTTYRPLADVRDEVIAAVRAQGAAEAAAAQAGALQDMIEAKALEAADDAAFIAAASEAGCTVVEAVELPEDNVADIDLGALGVLTGRNARSIGLVAGKPGEYISDMQRTDGGKWVVIRFTGRREAQQRPLSEPDVRDAVREYLAARRAYPKLLEEAEALRARAEAAGPGGLRKVFAEDAEVAARWSTSVERRSLDAMASLTPPEPADEGAARGDARLAVSLAVAGNPIMLAAERSDGDIPRVRLVQCVGLTEATPMPEQALASSLQRVRQAFGYGLMNQAYQALERDLAR